MTEIGVDIGGTFTDVVLIATDGSVRTSKAPTTPADFSDGVMDAIRRAAADLGTEPPDLLARTDLVNHGSTVATNALLTRRGATVGLITTRGFEDTPLVMRAVGRVDGLPEVVAEDVLGACLPPELSLASYVALGSGLEGLPPCVYDPHTDTVGPPRALDPARLATAVRGLIDDPARYARWSAAGPEHVRRGGLLPRDYRRRLLGALRAAARPSAGAESS